MNPDCDLHILLEKTRNGDAIAFGKLYKKYFSNVYCFSYKFLRSRVLAEDCTQLTFIRIWERRAHLNPALNFKSYLFTICRNCVLKTISRTARADKLKDMILQEYQADVHTHQVDIEEMERTAQKILDQLPPQRQLIFRLCKIEGKSYDEVALDLGISSGTVRDHMFKAGKAIRRYINLHRIITLLFACISALI